MQNVMAMKEWSIAADWGKYYAKLISLYEQLKVTDQPAGLEHFTSDELDNEYLRTLARYNLVECPRCRSIVDSLAEGICSSCTYDRFYNNKGGF